MTDTLKSSAEWEDEFDFIVIDPDGWDRTNLSESWSEKITRVEFEKRAMMSSIRFV